MEENSLDITDNDRVVLVTVGTTCFDELITETNKPEFHKVLRNLGYSKLVVQFGNGHVIPSAPSIDHLTNPSFLPLPIISFRYKSDLRHEFEHADLVISHGGAGTCMQALSPPGRRRLVIVINTSLMGNHQEELASALADGKHALVTTPIQLINLLVHGQSSSHNNLLVSKPVDINRLLGPSVPPLEAGFRAFNRGNPERLLHYLDRRLGLKT